MGVIYDFCYIHSPTGYYPIAFDAITGGGSSSEYCHNVRHRKTRIVVYHAGGERTKCDGMFSRVVCVTLTAWENLSVQSNQSVQSKRKSVQSEMRKRAVQLLAYLQFRPLSFDDLWYDQCRYLVLLDTAKARVCWNNDNKKIRLRPGTPLPTPYPTHHIENRFPHILFFFCF